MMRQNVNGLFNREELRLVRIPLPPLEVQRALVSELEAERALVDSNRKLITRMEKRMQAKLAEIWGEETRLEENLVGLANSKMTTAE
jgi:type I restriction enzyme M protein